MYLKGRKVDNLGRTIFNEDGLIEMLMVGNNISDLYAEPTEDIVLYNKLCKYWDHPEDSINICEYSENVSSVEMDILRQNKWTTPEPYNSLDITHWLMKKCKTDDEIERVTDELLLFYEKNMESVLKFLIYLVNHFRERNILWGIGRGSSVSSYVLYLIGIHRVDSIKYGLNVREFLK